jgi:hypothetical protein
MIIYGMRNSCPHLDITIAPIVKNALANLRQNRVHRQEHDDGVIWESHKTFYNSRQGQAEINPGRFSRGRLLPHLIGIKAFRLMEHNIRFHRFRIGIVQLLHQRTDMADQVGDQGLQQRALSVEF